MQISLQSRFRKFAWPFATVFALLLALVLALVSFSATPSNKGVFIASKNLAEGQVLTASDLKLVKVPLGDLAAGYLSRFKSNMVLSHSLLKGQLISKNEVSFEPTTMIPIRLNNLRPISKAINVGDHVDIWATQPNREIAPTNPEPVAFDAIVTLIESENSMAQNLTSLEIRISSDYLESLLAASDSNSQLSVILHETLADIP